MTIRLPRAGLDALSGVVLLLAGAWPRALAAAPSPPLPPASGVPSSSSSSSSSPSSSASPSFSPSPGGAPVGAAVGPPRVVATRDASPSESDHDTVVGAWGVEVTPVAARLPVFALRPSTGCPLPPAAQATPVASDCPAVQVSALGIRHWMTRGLAIDAAMVVALGGGRDHGRLLDTYLAVGPMLGAAVLLGNWKHMAVMASPGAAVVVFRAAKSVDTTYVIDFHANLEAELHFGFWGLPALSLSLRSGLALRIERAVDVTQFTFGPNGAATLNRLVTDLSLRYYF